MKFFKFLFSRRREKERIDPIGLNPEFFIYYIVPIIISIIFVLTIFFVAKKAIQDTYREHKMKQNLEIEKIAAETMYKILNEIEKDENKKKILKEIIDINYKEQKRLEEIENIKTSTNQYYKKITLEKYPIGTYVFVNKKDVGKVKSVNGLEITTYEGFECYYLTDDIEYLSYSEYKKLKGKTK